MLSTTAIPRTTVSGSGSGPADGAPALSPIIASKQLAAYERPDAQRIGPVLRHRFDTTGRAAYLPRPPVTTCVETAPQLASGDHVKHFRRAGTHDDGVGVLFGQPSLIGTQDAPQSSLRYTPFQPAR